jgi:hypothetical protein
MESTIKNLFRPLWRILLPVTRPIVRKFDQHALHLLHQIPLPPEPPADLDLVLNSVVRELARLHVQIEVLQRQIHDLGQVRPDIDGARSQLSAFSDSG